MSENFQIYFPNDFNKTLGKLDWQQYFILGYRYDSIYVLVQLITTDTDDLKLLPANLNGLEIVGAISSTKTCSFKYDLRFFYSKESPYVTIDKPLSLIIQFDPPNFKNLEYFSIKPILLQSMNAPTETETHRFVEHLMNVEHAENIPPTNKYAVSDDVIIDKINLVLKTRIDFKEWKGVHVDSVGLVTKLVQQLKWAIFRNLLNVIDFSQRILIFWIRILNRKFYHDCTLVSTFNTFRQVDLRLKQLNYFPVQFLFYYDQQFALNNHKSAFIDSLDLPIFNSNLNFNNSNYINLYTSIWLMFNDVLVGITVHKIIVQNFDVIIDFIHKFFIQKYLHYYLLDLISWVSKSHPAGFKLNDELGNFMGDLFIWSLNYWKFLINDIFETKLSPHLKLFLLSLLKLFIKALCYFGGISFLLAFINDIIKNLTIHITGFYFTSTKIYKRQIQVLMSLFQLFRGKKYNVLRNRIDNLNNYTIEMTHNTAKSADVSSSFEIDQLLLGTLLFIILIFLLPTVFAFYFLFFMLRLSLLVVTNLLENLQIIINFTPLFVILLKLKNSNRLQGGIKFQFVTNHNSVSYLKLSNIALSHNEIFINFIKLFSNSKTFKSQLIHSFLHGDLIRIKYNHDLKFHYLMLPRYYDRTTEVKHYLANRVTLSTTISEDHQNQ